MKYTLIFMIIKFVSLILGSVITVSAVWLFFVTNLNTGVFLTLLLGVALISASVMPQKLLVLIPRWLKILFVSAICAVFVFGSVLIICGSRDTANFSEDAVIVLGAGVRGRTPSLTLRRRLDRAVEYHEKNPDALIVVSGGQGTQEDITEAEAMESYLLDKGIPFEKIIREDAAHSTYTNFKFSKEILDGHFDEGYSIAFITNEYHTLRAHLLAEKCGFDEVSSFHSNTTLSYMIPGTLRECLAVVKYLVLGE